jgi:murein DD-endopeptidase MepM/ murein hydrolase activator NlpD
MRLLSVLLWLSAAGDDIGLPIAGLRKADIQDTYSQTRGSDRQHEAVDILAPRGTPVHAVVDGVVKKLFLSKPGGITVYQFDVCEERSFYYAHLDRYAKGLKEGRFLKRGEVLGYVGFTGNANPKAPHLHFAIFELRPDKKWWEGTPVNPYPLLLRAL